MSAEPGQHENDERDEVDETTFQSDGPSPLPVAPADASRIGSHSIEDRYTSRGLIAEGGMGAVIHVHDRNLERDVALKTMREDPDSRRGIDRRRFMREARIHGRLEHPGVAPVHDLGITDSGTPYFTMKLVRGQTLTQALSDLRARLRAGEGEASFSLRARLDVFARICEAVAYAHSHGILHRDLKPSNVMLGEFGEVQVMDWGLARVVRREGDDTDSGAMGYESDAIEADSEEAMLRAIAGFKEAISGGLSSPTPSPGSFVDTPTVDGTVVGTPPFMSPEQAAGQVRELDARSDVYSLGAILYTLLCFRAPFAGRDASTVLEQVKRGDFLAPGERLSSDPELGAIALKVSDDLEAIALKAMALSPADRYQSAVELAEDVQRYLEGQFVRASSYSWIQRVEHWVRKHRGKLLTAMVLVLAIGGGLYVAKASAARARERQIEQDLSRIFAEKAALATAAAGLDAQESLGGFDEALKQANLLLARANALREDVVANRSIEVNRPEWRREAAGLVESIATQSQRLLQSWIASIEASRPVGAERELSVEDDAKLLAAIERDFAAMSAHAWAADPEGRSIALLPWWLAQAAAVEADRLDLEMAADRPPPAELLERWQRSRARVVEMVARAWLIDPQSRPAAEGLLLVADRACESASSTDTVRDLAARYRELGARFAGPFPDLRVRAVIGEARALLLLHPSESAPLLPEISAPRQAVGRVLEAITPGGEWTAQSRAALAQTPRDMQASMLMEARDLLSIGRRVVVVGASAPGQHDPWLPGTFIAHEGSALVRRRVTLDESDPLAPPQFIEVGHVDLRPLAAEQEFKIEDILSISLLCARAGGARALIQVRRPNQRVDLIVLQGLDPLVVKTRVELPYGMYSITQGDIDGDGEVDLVMSTGNVPVAEDRNLVVVMHCKDGVFQERVIVDHPEHLEAGSQRNGADPPIVVADLDDDGRDEIAYARTPWYHNYLELRGEEKDGSFATLGRLRFGFGRVYDFESGATRFLMATPRFMDSMDINFRSRDIFVPWHPRFFTLADRKIKEIKSPWSFGAWMFDRGEYCGQTHPLEHADGALISEAVRRTIAGGPGLNLNRWLFYDGLPLTPKQPRVRMAGERAFDLVEGVKVTSRGLSRVLSDEALALIQKDPAPSITADADDGVHDAHLARTLLAFGYSAEAARVAADGLSHSTATLERHQLMRLQIRGLREAGKGRDLIELVNAMQPAEIDVDLFITAVDSAIQVSGRFEQLIESIESWSRDSRVSQGERQHIARLYAGHLSAARGLETNRVVVRENQVISAAGASRSLADYWWTSDPGLVIFEHARTREAGLTALGRSIEQGMDSGLPGGSDVVPTLAARNPAETGESGVHSWRIEGHRACSGFFVDATNGSSRIAIQFKLNAPVWASRSYIGLFPVGATARGGIPLLEIGCGGGAGVDQVRIRNSAEVDIDELIGEELRIEIDFLQELAKRRTTVTRVATGEVVSAAVDEQEPMPRGELLLLGVLSMAEGLRDMTITQIDLAGNIVMTPRDDPRAIAILERNWQIAMVSRAAAAEIEGDKEQAAALLEEVAREVLAAARQHDGATAACFLAKGQRFLIESVARRAGNDVTALTAGFSALSADGIKSDALIAWRMACRRPDPLSEIWHAIGNVIVMEQDLTPEEIAQRIDAPFFGEFEPGLSALALWIRAARIADQPIDESVFFGRILAIEDPERDHQLVLMICDLLPPGAPVPKLSSKDNEALIPVLLYTLRREQALTLVERFASLEEIEPEITQHSIKRARMVRKLRVRDLEVAIERSRIRGY